MLCEKQFHPHLSKQMFLKTCHKIGISITYDELMHFMVPNPHVKEQFCLIESCCGVKAWLGGSIMAFESA
jgi:hypothetical protein